MATEDIIARYKLDIADLQAKTKALETEFSKIKGAAEKAGQASKKAFSESGKETSAFGTSMNALAGKIAAAFAVERIIAFGAASVKAFADAEKTAKLLQTAVGVSGGLGRDFDRLIKQSKDLEKIGIFSDDTIQKVQTAALQFGLTSEQVEKLIPLVTDFASATGQDLSAALDNVLRGIEGQERGLKKYGISLVEGASRVENLDRITQQLNKTYLGQAEIVGNTASGAMAKYNNEINNLEERVGEKLEPKLRALKTLMLEIAEGAVDASDKIAAGFNFLFDKEAFFQNEGERLKRLAKESAEEEAKANTIQELRIKLGEARNKNENILLENRTAIEKKDDDEIKRTFFLARQIQGQIDGYRKLIDLKTKSKTPAPEGGLSGRDAEDAAVKALEAQKKAADELAKLKKDAEEKEKARMEGAFQFMLDLIDQETAAELDAGKLSEDAEKEKLEKIKQLRIDFGKDVGDITLKQAQDEAKIREDAAKAKIKLEQDVIEQYVKDADDTQARAEAQIKRQAEQEKELRMQLAQETANAVLEIYFAIGQSQRDAAIQRITEESDAQNAADDAASEALQKKIDRGLITEAAGAKEKKKLDEQRAKNEITIQKKINDIKHQQDVANQQQALFSIAINTAATVLKTTSQEGFIAGGLLVPLIIAMGVLQAATVLAAPLPKYFKGTEFLQRGKNPSGRDTIPLLGHEGEAIIPAHRNKNNPGLAKAWITGDLDRYLNAIYVTPALKKQKEIHEKSITINSSGMSSADMDLLAQKFAAELEFMQRGGKRIDLSTKSLKELAAIIELNNDLRR